MPCRTRAPGGPLHPCPSHPFLPAATRRRSPLRRVPARTAARPPPTRPPTARSASSTDFRSLGRVDGLLRGPCGFDGVAAASIGLQAHAPPATRNFAFQVDSADVALPSHETHRSLSHRPSPRPLLGLCGALSKCRSLLQGPRRAPWCTPGPRFALPRSASPGKDRGRRGAWPARGLAGGRGRPSPRPSGAAVSG